MLEPEADVDTTISYSTADPNTLVVAQTSTGHPIGVSLLLASSPVESWVRVHFPKDLEPFKHANEIMVAHNESMLIKVAREREFEVRPDNFIYNAGTAAANSSPKPPSLSLLPVCSGHLHK